jgi:excisionase family DNA binding protein
MVLNVEEAAQYLRVSTWTIRERCKDGTLPHRMLGRRLLLCKEQLDSWMENRRKVSQCTLPTGSESASSV